MTGNNIFSREERDALPFWEKTDQYAEKGLASLFYEGLRWKGKPTRIYAYLGFPAGSIPAGGWPAVVMVHGGGGTAFPWAVREWNSRGFACIAMDLEGHLPQQDMEHDRRTVFEGSGPQRQGIFEDWREPIRDQWFCQALGQIARAHSLLRSLPEINKDKTGIMGISWGGILTCVTAGIDDRYKFVVSVYGCGFLDESKGQLKTTKEMSKLWDPRFYLPDNRGPILFVNGDEDAHFPRDTWEKTCACSGGRVTSELVPGMKHGHQPPFERQEIFNFARSAIA